MVFYLVQHWSKCTFNSITTVWTLPCFSSNWHLTVLWGVTFADPSPTPMASLTSLYLHHISSKSARSPQVLSAERRGSGWFKQDQRRCFYIPVSSCFVQSCYHWFVHFRLQLTCIRAKCWWTGLVWIIGLLGMPRICKIVLTSDKAVWTLFDVMWHVY